MNNRPANSSIADNLVAIEQAQGVQVNFLGFLIWYSVADCRITKEELRQLFQKAGIDEKRLPKDISERDAFRRATKAGEAKRIQLDAKGERFLNVLVRDVRQTDKQIIRQLVREVVDSENVRLEYQAVADLIYQENGIHLIPKMDLLPDERQAIDLISKAFDIERECYNGRTMRDIIGGILAGCRPVNVRPSGGVYFVARQYEKEVEAIKEFASGLDPYNTTHNKTRCWSVPVVDAEEQRGMLQESLEEQVKKDSKSLIGEITKLLNGNRTITQNLANQYVDRAKALAKLVKEYEEMLEFQSIKAKADLELAMQAAMKVLDKVEVV